MDTSINGRIKQLRKDQGLSQQEFGDRINLKQSAVSKMEQEGSSVIEQNIQLICSTFNVNEEWLRTGEADNMYEETNDTLLKQLANQYKLEGERLELIRNFLMLTDEQQEAIVRAACVIAEANKKAMETAKAAPAPAPPTGENEASAPGADSAPPAAPKTDTDKRPEGLSDEEWEVIQHLRMEKSTQMPTASSSTRQI